MCVVYVIKSPLESGKNPVQEDLKFLAVLCNKRSFSAMDIVFRMYEVILNLLGRGNYDRKNSN